MDLYKIKHYFTTLLLTLTDECVLGTHKCHSDAICTDTTSSYTCACKPEYVGNGFLCGKNRSSLVESFGLSNFRKYFVFQLCVLIQAFILDMNQCANNPCQNSGTCVDGVGDYACTCLHLYYGKNCQYRGKVASHLLALHQL